MSFGTVFIVVMFGFSIVVLTGLGILTNAVFHIHDGIEKKLVKLAVPAVPAVPAVAEVVAAVGVLPVAAKPAIPAVPEQPAVFEDKSAKIIDINDPSLIITKISLITFWILILFSIIGTGIIF